MLNKKFKIDRFQDSISSLIRITNMETKEVYVCTEEEWPDYKKLLQHEGELVD